MARKVAGMIMAERAQAGRMILSRAAMSNGMSSFFFALYSNAIASLILLPSFLFHRSSERPPLTLLIVSGFFLLGLSGFALLFRIDL